MRRFLLAVAAAVAATGFAIAQSGSVLAPFTNVGEPASLPPAVVDAAGGGDAVQTLAGPRVWATGEYGILWVRKQGAPLLVSTLPDANALGGGQTLPEGTPITPLYPTNGKIDFGAHSAVRARVGATLTDLFGIDVGGFALESRSAGGTFSSPGSPVLAQTYLGTAGDTTNYLYYALPGRYSGRVTVFADSQMWGLDANARLNWYRVFSDRNDALVGFRYVNFSESLLVNVRSVFPSGTVISTLDGFRADNHIYVGQAGLQSQFSMGRATLDVVNKFGLGGAGQRVQIFGGNTITGQPDETTGLYTQATNIGTFERTRFVAVGEFGLTAGYALTPRVNVSVGYNLQWISSVVRPGSAIDRTVNDRTIRFVADRSDDMVSRRPAFDFNRASTDVWIQGVTFGVTAGF